ncbi:unnamed protein product [Ixodes pacificus]
MQVFITLQCLAPKVTLRVRKHCFLTFSYMVCIRVTDSLLYFDKAHVYLDRGRLLNLLATPHTYACTPPPPPPPPPPHLQLGPQLKTFVDSWSRRYWPFCQGVWERGEWERGRVKTAHHALKKLTNRRKARKQKKKTFFKHPG